MKRWLRGVLVGTGALIITGALWFGGVLDRFEWSTYDMRVRALARSGENTHLVKTILLDQESLDWAEETLQIPWPWPREVLTYIVDFVSRGNPKALAFDVLYTELSDYEFSDDAFAASIESFGDFVAAVHLEETVGQAGAEPWPPGSLASIEIDGFETWLDSPWGTTAVYPDATFPIPQVVRAAEYLGNVNADPDGDAVFRAIPLVAAYQGRAVPSLALATVIAGSTEDLPVSINRNKLSIGNTNIVLDRLGRAVPRFRGPSGTHEAIKAAAILRSQIMISEGASPEVDPEIFKDGYILFGYSAQGLKDLRASPVDSEYPGVEVHATLIDNILSDDFITPTNTPVAIVLAIIISLATAMTITIAKNVVGQVASFAVFLAVPVGVGFAGYALGFWIPMVFLELTALFSLIGGTAANYFTEGRQKRFLKTAFQFYLSPEVIEDIIDDPDQLSLGGRRETLSIFFSDLEGFTTITESLQERTPDLINEYLTPMANIIFDENGTIDKYEGDAIIAFWNAPKRFEDHALRCVRTALRCQAELSRLREDFANRYGHELHMRIGMNTGKALVGNMGSQTRFDYTMLGDAVNLAARLEGANKIFGTYTMISEYTKSEIHKVFPTRELGRIIVKGKTQPVSVFEPYLPEDFEQKRETVDVFEKGLQAFYAQEISEARRYFEQIAQNDPAAASYVEACDGLDGPDPDWTGVLVLKEK